MMQGRNQVGGEIRLDHISSWRSSLDHWREWLWGESVDTENPILPLPWVHFWQSHHHLLPGVASSPICLLVPLPHSHFSLEAKWCFKNMLVCVPPLPRSPPKGLPSHSVSLLTLVSMYPPLNLSSSCTQLPHLLHSESIRLLTGPCKCQVPVGLLHCNSFSPKHPPPDTCMVIPHFLQPSAQYHWIRKVFPDHLYKVILLIISTCCYPFDLPADIIYF